MSDEEELMITEYMENRTPSPQYSPAEYSSESETEEGLTSLVESITEKDIGTGLKKSAIILKVKKLHQKLAEKPTGIKKQKKTSASREEDPLDKNNDPQEILDYLKAKLISYEEHQKTTNQFRRLKKKTQQLKILKSMLSE